MAIARFRRDVRVLLRHDGPRTGDRREDVLNQRRDTQHDVAVSRRHHLWTCLPSTADSTSQADTVRSARDTIVTDSIQRSCEATTSPPSTGSGRALRRSLRRPEDDVYFSSCRPATWWPCQYWCRRRPRLRRLLCRRPQLQRRQRVATVVRHTDTAAELHVVDVIGDVTHLSSSSTTTTTASRQLSLHARAG